MRLHSAWRLFYGKLAWMYDLVSGCVSHGKWRSWCRASIPYLKQKRVLELAHGPGHLLLALRTAGYEPCGIDVSPIMGRQAARRLRRAGFPAPLVRCRAQALPFRPGSFDEAVATFPTDYILDPKTISEVARVTSDRGRLVIVAGAQRKSPRPDPHFMGWLSGLTGRDEDGKDGGKSIFHQAGMKPRVECRPVGEGTVMLIVAEKRPGDRTPAGSFAEERLRLPARQDRRPRQWVPVKAGRPA